VVWNSGGKLVKENQLMLKGVVSIFIVLIPQQMATPSEQ
jgi:hypothetical protein